jgi:transcriptional regulator with XRE-family HTH domain
MMKRRQVSEAIAALGWTGDDGEPLTWGQDIIGKYETGARKPSIDAFKALCEVLRCDPRMLMPGGPDVTMPEEAIEREARLDHNRELRWFARKYGLKYKNRATNRVYYRRELRAAYALSVDIRMARAAGDEAALARLEEEFTEALARVPKDHQAGTGSNEDSGVPLAS